jgi:hypothetical protein
VPFLEVTVYLDKIFGTRMVFSFLHGTRILVFINFSVIAAQSISNIVKSSLGPLGLDKMLVDNIGVR